MTKHTAETVIADAIALLKKAGPQATIIALTVDYEAGVDSSIACADPVHLLAAAEVLLQTALANKPFASRLNHYALSRARLALDALPNLMHPPEGRDPEAIPPGEKH